MMHALDMAVIGWLKDGKCGGPKPRHLLSASPKPQTLFLPLVKLAIFAMLILTMSIHHHGGIESGID
jgi:hypothetical protein